MRVNVSDGMPYGICGSCKCSTIAKMDNGGLIGRCSEFGARLYRPVVSCNGYQEKGRQDLYDMKQAAFIIEINPKGKVGFLKPGDTGHKEAISRLVNPLTNE